MLSVILITKNEEKLIKVCLESVKWADEIIIADNGSTDKTLEIAKQYTDKIFEVSGHDFSHLRNMAIKKAKGDWVFYVDADERVLANLKDEVLQTINQTKFSALAVSRENIIFGQNVRYGPYKKDWVIRLLKKSQFKHWVGKVHEYPQFEGELGYLKNQMLHLTHRDVDHVVLKSLEWSKIDAMLRFESKHPQMTSWRFFRIFLVEVFNQGIIRRGFFNGAVGVVDSLLQAYSLFITYVRLWQMQSSPSIEDKYLQIDKNLAESDFKSFK